MSTRRRDRTIASDVSDKTDREAAYERKSAEAARARRLIEEMDQAGRRRLEERRNGQRRPRR